VKRPTMSKQKVETVDFTTITRTVRNIHSKNGEVRGTVKVDGKDFPVYLDTEPEMICGDLFGAIWAMVYEVDQDQADRLEKIHRGSVAKAYDTTANDFTSLVAMDLDHLNHKLHQTYDEISRFKTAHPAGAMSPNMEDSVDRLEATAIILEGQIEAIEDFRDGDTIADDEDICEKDQEAQDRADFQKAVDSLDDDTILTPGKSYVATAEGPRPTRWDTPSDNTIQEDLEAAPVPEELKTMVKDTLGVPEGPVTDPEVALGPDVRLTVRDWEQIKFNGPEWVRIAVAIESDYIEAARTRRELKNTRKQLADSVRLNNELHQVITEKLALIASLEAAQEEARKVISGLTVQKDDLAIQVDNLKLEVSDHIMAGVTIAEKLDWSKTSVKALEAKVKDMKAEWEADLKENRAKIRDLAGKLTVVNKELTQARMEVDWEGDTVHELEAKCLDLSEQVEAKDQELADVRKQLTEAQNELSIHDQLADGLKGSQIQ